jgi:hypothetical protein
LTAFNRATLEPEAPVFLFFPELPFARFSKETVESKQRKKTGRRRFFGDEN